MSALLQAPSFEREDDGSPSDHGLVAAVRRGDQRAFEALYERYHRRIHAYVQGMVKDHGRAEDVTQEVFVSALRRMGATERPIAFKPWIYEIAKNACIDQFRRSKRAEVVSIDGDDGLSSSDYGRLVSTEPIPDAAVAVKQDLDHLCGAFGGLSDTHHQILVLRELEGLSYRDIGERLGMSRPAVESTLFRARRRLTEEYDELASGERCHRIQSIIASVSRRTLGARDSRRLARHVANCQPCRREAIAAGMDAALLTHRPMRERVAAKVGALLPFPGLLRFRRGGTHADAGWVANLPAVSDQVGAGGAKLAAMIMLLVAGLGAGMGTQIVTDADGSKRDRAGESRSSSQARPAASDAAGAASSERGVSPRATTDQPRAGRLDRAHRGPAARDGHQGDRRNAADPDAPASGAAPDAAGGATDTSTGSTRTRLVPLGRQHGARRAPAIALPAIQTPALQTPEIKVTPTSAQPVRSVVETVRTLEDAAAPTVQGVAGAVDQITGNLP